MSAQHTPGPWESREILAMRVIVIAQTGKMHPHASVARWTDASEGPPSINDEERANARLIAAAPELLAALVQAFPILTRLAETQRQERGGSGLLEGPECNTAEYLAYAAARAAIAKAVRPAP